MYDKRVFRGNTHGIHTLKGSEKNMTAAEKDEVRIKAEREVKKIDMIKSQLQHFKKAKSKTSPYDLNPGPPARIEVDLTYFLTEQGRQKPEENDVKCQTDVFMPRPPTPKYVPKKTGIDKITQIEDFDLFDYDREVQPILNVLLTKSVEQALLEVEEETELDEIRKFKGEYEKRQVSLHDCWEEEVKREIQRIKHKNKVLKQARAKRDQ
jgi:radial spoke head protein 3